MIETWFRRPINMHDNAIKGLPAAAAGSTDPVRQIDLETGPVVKEGANARAGVTAAMVAGTIVVPTTAVRATSRIFLTAQTVAGTPGALAVSARTSGTGFSITSSSNTDTSTVAWLIVTPA